MRVTFILTSILLLSGTGTLAAQEKHLTSQERWAKIRAERMTECIAHEFGLSDKQKKELQKANEIWLLEYGDCHHYRYVPCRDRHGYRKRRHRHRGSCGYYDSHRPTDSCCYEDFSEDDEKYEAARKEYQKALKRILNKEQYQKYKDNSED